MNASKVRRVLKKSLKYTGISLSAVLVLLFVLPYFFPDTIARGVTTWTNERIRGKMAFGKMRLSFFKHFPSLTLTLYDFSLKGAPPYTADTLVAADEIAFGVNLRSILFEKKVLIDQVYLDDARLNVQVDSMGNANYNVYISGEEATATPQGSDSAGASLKIQKISIKDCRLVYHDRSIPMYIHADGFNYTGTGDLSNAVFDLSSRLDVKALDFSFDGEEYLKDKAIHANLVTQVNTNSLVLLFQRNDLNINKLKLDFTGELKFLSNGYLLDFSVGTKQAPVYSVVTALPPKYLSWLEQTELRGSMDFLFTLKGNYIAAQNEKPDIRFDMTIRDAYVSYRKSAPATAIQLRLRTLLPDLNTDSLKIDLDTLSFRMEQDYFDAAVHTTGLDRPYIRAGVRTDIDLAKFQRALGYEGIDLAGRLKLELRADGPYMPDTIRHTISSIPVFEARASLSAGYFKMASLPEAVHDIRFQLLARCPDNNYQHTSVRIEALSAKALNNVITGFARLDNLVDYPLDARLQSTLNLAELQQFIPMDSLSLAGLLQLDATLKGNYRPDRKQFPVMRLDLDLKDGAVQTKYYPNPISNILVKATVSDATGTAQGLRAVLQPLSFDFEGKPFLLKATLSDLENLRYDISAKGDLDLQRIYHVFARKDLDISGLASMNLHLAGRQSDAVRGRYQHLQHSGHLKFRDLSFAHAGYLPKPFVITEGLFTFTNDKMRFDRFRARYGHSDITLNGYLSNVIGYLLSDRQPLRGHFDLVSRYLLVDEFMSATTSGDTLVAGSNADTSGVIVIPANLALSLDAKARRISYNGLLIHDFSGRLQIDSAQLRLLQTLFHMAGTEVAMEAMYRNSGLKKAFFDFRLQAKDFDVRRAYKEVKMFHDMVPAAAKARGIISLDYALSGRLDRHMSPVYPSLAGGGVLSVRDVQFAGFRLLNHVSSASGKEAIKDPNVKNVNIRTQIRNNVISLEKVKIKMAGFRLRIQGETSFDSRLNFKMRLGLPPLGIIGIPMTVTGTSDNPKVKLGRQETQALPETEEEYEAPEEDDASSGPADASGH